MATKKNVRTRIKRSERNPMVQQLLEGPIKGRTHELLHVEHKIPDQV